MEPAHDVIIQAEVVTDPTGEPVESWYGTVTVRVRCVDEATGAALTVEFPTGQRQALAAVSAMGDRVLELVFAGVEQMGAES